MVNATEPWLIRSGNHNTSPSSATGVFTFDQDRGNANTNFSFRHIVITNKNVNL